MKKTNPAAVDSPWFDRNTAAAYLQVSPDTLNRWRRESDLPEHAGPGGRPRFHRDELDAWLRSRCTTTPKKASPKTTRRTADASRGDDDTIPELVG